MLRNKVLKKFLAGVQKYRGGGGVKAKLSMSVKKQIFSPDGFPKINRAGYTVFHSWKPHPTILNCIFLKKVKKGLFHNVFVSEGLKLGG